MSTLLRSLSSLKWKKKEGQWTTWQSKAKHLALATTVYYNWKAMNISIFESFKPQVDSILKRIKTPVYKFMFALYSYILIQFESLTVGP